MSERDSDRKRRKPRIVRVILVIVLVPVGVIGIMLALLVYSTTLKERPPSAAKGILRAGKLADLPESAYDVRAAGWHSMFTGMDYLRFCATASDIEKFISDSPSIEGIKPEVFDSKHMLLPIYDLYNADFSSGHTFFHPEKGRPSWYDRMLMGRGRRYYFCAGPKGHNQGTVIVNYETNTVYINVTWS